jgi:2-methylcitrate dehydratase PrpD
MNIEQLEVNLFKTSQINDGDTVLVKIDNSDREKLKKEDVQALYDKIKSIVKKDISIYFFPKHLSIDIIKNHVKNIESSKETILSEPKQDNNNENENENN